MIIARKWLPAAVVLMASHALVFWLARSSSPSPVSKGGDVVEESGEIPGSRSGRERDRDRVAIEDIEESWRLLHEADLPRAEFVVQRDRLLIEWMKQDLGAVLDLLCGPGTPGEFRHPPIEVSVELKKRIADRSAEVMRWIREGRFGSGRQEAFSMWVSALYDVPDRQAIIGELEGMTNYERNWSIQLITNHLGLEEAPMLRDVIVKVVKDDHDDLYADTIRSCYAGRLVELAWESPARVFKDETDPQLLRALGEEWAKKMFGSDPAPAKLDQLAALPDAARPGVLNSIYNAADERGVDGVLPLLREMERLEYWNDLAHAETSHAVLVIAERSEDAARRTAEWVAGIEDGKARGNLIPAVAEAYERKNESACLEWLTSLPPAADRDVAAAQLLRRGVGGKVFRSSLLNLIQDPALAAELAPNVRAE
jgi:hypothetical protein